MAPSSKVADAYAVLGLEEGVTLEVVRTTYKQIALRTHPDKNPDNPSATAEFQHVSEAYRVLEKHLTAPSKPSAPRGHPFFGGFAGHSSDDEYDYDDEYDEYSDDDEDLAFYMWIFEEIMANRMYRASRHAHHNHHRPSRYQTPEEYQEQVRRSREEQLAAQERRKQEAIARKERAAREREQERLDAELRQKQKIEVKKAQAEAARRESEERARAIRRSAQEIRSSVFAAARQGESDKVKKGVWEQAVDAAGGEIKPGCAAFVKVPPQDPQETLLHIAVTKNDLELFEWLDSHSADQEERNSEGLTAFHLALKMGRVKIVNYVLENYSPKDSDSKAIYDCSECSNLLALALESAEPELVWMVLDKRMASATDINQAWAWATSQKGLQALKKSAPETEKSEDVIKLLMRYGGFPPPSTPLTSSGIPEKLQQQKSAAASHTQPPTGQTAPSQKQNNRGRGHGRGRGRGTHNTRPAH